MSAMPGAFIFANVFERSQMVEIMLGPCPSMTLTLKK